MEVKLKREKFATQVKGELLKEMRSLAQSDGRHLQALVEEAFVEYIERRHGQRVRPHVMDAYEASVDRYSSVYEKLAR